MLDKILYHKFKSHKISDKQFSLLSGINKNICKENFSKKIKDIIFEEEYILNKYLLSADILEFPYKNVYLLILNMGLRVGEVLALKQQLNIARANPNNFLFLSKNHTLVNPGTINKILQKSWDQLILNRL